jgi:hypothetical protein
VGCSVDRAGLGGEGAAGTTGAVAGTSGGTGSGGVTGAGGITGQAGAGAAGHAGSAGPGTAGAGSGTAGTVGTVGTGGSSGTAGDSGGGAGTSDTSGTGGGAGTVSTSGAGGDAGAAGSSAAGAGGAAGDGSTGTGGIAGSGAAGSGAAGTGAAGSGAAGTGGRGGRGGSLGCTPSTCPDGCCQGNQCITNTTDQMCGSGAVSCHACDPCFRCGTSHSCEPDPSAGWTVTCVSASIKSTKPNGTPWDPATGFGTSALPDPYCQLQTSDSRVRATMALMDTLTPVWNANVTPTTGGGLTEQELVANGWTISVFDQDPAVGPGGPTSELVCSTKPAVDGTTLSAGSLEISNVGSCITLDLAFMCAK